MERNTRKSTKNIKTISQLVLIVIGYNTKVQDGRKKTRKENGNVVNWR